MPSTGWAEQVKTENRQDGAQLLDEKCHVRTIGLGEAGKIGVSAVCKHHRTSLLRQSDDPALEEPCMGLGQVVVLADHERDPVEEIHVLVGLVAAQSLADAVRLSDIRLQSRRAIRVGTDEHVDSGPFGLLAANK